MPKYFLEYGRKPASLSAVFSISETKAIMADSDETALNKAKEAIAELRANTNDQISGANLLKVLGYVE